MKRATFSILTLIVLAGLTGCVHHRQRPSAFVGGKCAACPQGDCATVEGGCVNGQSCEDPGDGGCGPAKKHCCGLLSGLCHRKHGGTADQSAGEAGPPAGAITYPYYTIRGPRDFYAKNPGSIGP
jgi:hypothetical protein